MQDENYPWVTEVFPRPEGSETINYHICRHNRLQIQSLRDKNTRILTDKY